MSIEDRFDVPLIGRMALQEKQIQQNYRPIIAVHKWFARRPGTLFRALTLAEFGEEPLEKSFFKAHDFSRRTVADPFMGGGAPLLEANRLGCDVIGFDINPMSAWIVREEIEHLDVAAYLRAAEETVDALRREIGAAYLTDCPRYGDRGVPVKYFLWVKCVPCPSCGKQIDLFPGYLLAENSRHPKNVLVCPSCGELNEAEDRDAPGDCRHCHAPLIAAGPAKRGRCRCAECGRESRYPQPQAGPPGHRLFAIEYYNPQRKAGHRGRFFKKPDAEDIARMTAMERRWASIASEFVPTQEIPSGDETDRLHRWGYRRYAEMFNPRQLLGLEMSCRLIRTVGDARLRSALATNLSDLLRYQNMLCRYDTWALKSLDIFSVHGFPVGLVQCESNLLGIVNDRNVNVGSGGWSNIIEKYAKAKRYCMEPFEVRRSGSRKIQVPIRGEWIGEHLDGKRRRKVVLRCGDARQADLPANSLDAAFTDPPYFGNVQYGELMDFCYAWLRRLAGETAEGFHRPSTRAIEELTGNATQSRGLGHFTEGLAGVFSKISTALKPGAPLAFTFHHNKFEAYFAVGVAILDAGLTCSASLPCPAEMSGSIHIHGTGSSIVDTVFVCRATGRTRQQWLFQTAEELADIVAEDLEQLREAGHKPTIGDTRCIVFGHLTRMAVWNLRNVWDLSTSTASKLERFAQTVSKLPDAEDLLIEQTRIREYRVR